MNQYKRRAVVSDLRNKLQPFWSLVELMTLVTPKDEIELRVYIELLEEAAEKAYDNIPVIEEKLNELSK